MKVVDKVKTEVKKAANQYFNDSKAVEMVEELIDAEYTNAEVISTLLDRVEELEDKVESLMENK